MGTFQSWWLFSFGDISVLVTIQFWWHLRFGDILVLVTIYFWWHFILGDILVLVTFQFRGHFRLNLTVLACRTLHFFHLFLSSCCASYFFLYKDHEGFNLPSFFLWMSKIILCVFLSMFGALKCILHCCKICIFLVKLTSRMFFDNVQGLVNFLQLTHCPIPHTIVLIDYGNAFSTKEQSPHLLSVSSTSTLCSSCILASWHFSFSDGLVLLTFNFFDIAVLVIFHFGEILVLMTFQFQLDLSIPN